jgi:hypothetical protein
MKISKISVLLPFVFAMGFSLFSAPAHAQASRTWISGVGDDVNPCSRTAPCKTFAGAISKTAPGGEIDVLDPGGFGAVSITKAITFDGGGGQVASILVAGTNGINVNAGANDVVILRNLRINGINQTANPGVNGISLNTGGTLIVEKCDIFGFASSGILLGNSTPAKVSISDSHIQNTGVNANTAGVLLQPTANLSVTVDNVYMETGRNGVFANAGATGNVLLNVRNSVITAMTGNGVAVATTGAAAASADVFNTQISFANGTGVSASGNGAARIGTSTITDNVTGVSASGVTSYKNNMIFGNVTNNTPITAVAGYAGNTGQ